MIIYQTSPCGFLKAMQAAHFKYFCTKSVLKSFLKVQDKRNRCALQGLSVMQCHVKTWLLNVRYPQVKTKVRVVFVK